MGKTKEKTRPSTSRPGVCDRCGCAVVRVHDKVHQTAILMKGNAAIDGHIYVNGELRQVRCAMHTERGDIPPAEDARGGSGDHRHGPFVRYCVEGARMADCCEREKGIHKALEGKVTERETNNGLVIDYFN